MRNIPALTDRFYSGDSKTVDIDVYDEDKQLVDMTGATARFKVFRGDEVLIEKETAGGGASINESRITVAFVPSDTESLGGTSFEVLKYECEVTDAGGNISTVARGLFTITADLIE
jgi:hypothetical protein